MRVLKRYFFILPMVILSAQTLLANTSERRRPNIVFVITDDQRWDALGSVQDEMGDRARFPWLETPRLDQLADEGLRFREAFAVNSVCSAARAGLLSGTYNHFNGVANNHTPISVDSVAVPKLLGEAGYATGMFGKWHMGRQSGHRPGFQISKSYIGHGQYYDCPFEVNGEKVSTVGWVDDVTTDYAIEFIKENQDRPFLAWVGLKSPHDDRKPARRHENDYLNDYPRPVVNLNRFPMPFMNAHQASLGAERDPKYLMDYFRTLNGVDECVGRLIDTLDELDLTEDTVFIFTSDNGYYLGEHCTTDKRMAHEESLRLPLIVKYPRLVEAGSLSDDMIINLDISATLLDIANVEVPASFQGRSMLPLFEGERPEDWRTSYFYEYFYEAKAWPPTVTAVRTESHKLIKYHFEHNSYYEMFNLLEDPYETKNLFYEPAEVSMRDEMLARYESDKKAVGFFIPKFADKVERNWPDQY